MLSSLFGYLKTCALLFLFNDYFKRNYPYEYQVYYITITYQLIALYSKAQIEIGKCIQYITEKHPDLVIFIQSFLIKKNTIKNNLQFIKNNDIIKEENSRDYLNKDEIIVTDCDFVIYLDNIEGYSNVKIINDVNLLDKKETYQYELTDYKFLLVEFMNNGKIYKINLSTDAYNFYGVDNILDDKFFLYYLKYYLLDFKQDSEIENHELLLKIIDDNVNSKLVELEKQYIKFGKNSYTIIDK